MITIRLTGEYSRLLTLANALRSQLSNLSFLRDFSATRCPEELGFINDKYKEVNNAYTSTINELRERLNLPTRTIIVPHYQESNLAEIYNAPKSFIPPTVEGLDIAEGDSEYGNMLSEAYPIEEDEETAKQRGDNFRAYSVTWQVTEACNLKCTYCYQINKSEHQMTFETAKKLVDHLLSDRFAKMRPNLFGIIIEFIGGEPFLMTDLCDRVLEYFFLNAIKLHHKFAWFSKVSMCSNGTLYFNDDYQAFLRKYGRVLSYSISIDGNKELHDSCRVFPDGTGSYDKAISACKHYKENYGSLPGTKMTIASSNIDYINVAVKSMMDIGWTHINLNCVYEDAWKPEDPLRLYKQLKELADTIIDGNLLKTHSFSIFDYNSFHPQDKVNDTSNYCGGNGAMLALDYQGKYYPCLRFMKSSIGDKLEPLYIGDTEVGIDGNEKYKKLHRSLLDITRQSQSDEKCMNCPVGSGCGWCTGFNYQTYGTANKRATFICKMHQARALANYYLWNKYFLTYNLPYMVHVYMPKDWALEIISEDEYNMLIDLEKKLLINDGDSDIELNILNVGQFDENNQEYPWEDLVDDEHRAKIVYDDNSIPSDKENDNF